MEASILQIIERSDEDVLDEPADCYIAMGSDIRFAAHEIPNQRVDDNMLEIDVNELDAFIDDIFTKTPDKIVTQYHFSLPDAESFGPGLLTHLMVAKRVGAKRFLVANVNLRDGLIQEMAQGRRWSASIHEQIVRNARQLGEKYQYAEDHAVHVAKLAGSLFDQLEPVHQMPGRFRAILELAALLHEIGQYVSNRSLHKHSLYLIRNSEIFGIGAHEKELVALVARYHRRATPQPNHDGFSRLNRKDRVTVAKLAALLRIANALDSSRAQRIQKLDCLIRGAGTEVLLQTDVSADLSMEQIKLKLVKPFFEDIFGCNVVLQNVSDS